MSASHELITLKGLSKQSWLTKDEQQRFRSLCQRWVRENPNATLPQITLVEDYVRNHILIQRLVDKRVFIDGSKTSYTTLQGRKESEIDSEDEHRKAREFEKWYPILMGIETKLLQLALANSIEVNVVQDISSLFGAMDATERSRALQYKGANGEA